MDNRLIETGVPPRRVFERANLTWFAEGDNHDYIGPEFVQIQDTELLRLEQAATDLHELCWEAVKITVERQLWDELGIPELCRPLLEYSVQSEGDLFLLGRFDFAGGIEQVPLKMLEYNADVCSLLPETAMLQKQLARHFAPVLNHEQPFNELEAHLEERWRTVLDSFPNLEPTLLVVHLGDQEDIYNCEPIAFAARQAGFERVETVHLKDVTFSADEGIFLQQPDGKYRNFGFLYKFVPWEIAAFDEPNLWRDLEDIVTAQRGVVLQPAWTFLAQNKALMQIMHDLEPHNPYLLRTRPTLLDFPTSRFVRKPRYGRMGENIQYYDGHPLPAQETGGDYAERPPVYQEVAEFNLDSDNCRYQPSIFYGTRPSGLAIRREEGLIVGDDAEYMGHVVV